MDHKLLALMLILFSSFSFAGEGNGPLRMQIPIPFEKVDINLDLGLGLFAREAWDNRDDNSAAIAGEICSEWGCCYSRYNPDHIEYRGADCQMVLESIIRCGEGKATPPLAGTMKFCESIINNEGCGSTVCAVPMALTDYPYLPFQCCGCVLDATCQGGSVAVGLCDWVSYKICRQPTDATKKKLVSRNLEGASSEEVRKFVAWLLLKVKNLSVSFQGREVTLSLPHDGQGNQIAAQPDIETRLKGIEISKLNAFLTLIREKKGGLVGEVGENPEVGEFIKALAVQL